MRDKHARAYLDGMRMLIEAEKAGQSLRADLFRKSLGFLSEMCSADERYLMELQGEIEAGENPRIEIRVFHTNKEPFEVTHIECFNSQVSLDGFIQWRGRSPVEIPGATIIVKEFCGEPENANDRIPRDVLRKTDEWNLIRTEGVKP